MNAVEYDEKLCQECSPLFHPFITSGTFAVLAAKAAAFNFYLGIETVLNVSITNLANSSPFKRPQ